MPTGLAQRLFRPSRYGARLVCLALLCLALTSSAGMDHQRMREFMRSHFDQSGLARLDAWQAMLERSQDLSEAEQLERVNRFFNRQLTFTDDRDIWGEEDYWATPLETLGKRHGDCEDYSIAKYISLRQLGVAHERLRLIYVRAQRASGSRAHMVLGYYATPEATPLILDNLEPRIQPAHLRGDLRPVFSFNSEGLWVGQQGDGARSDDHPTARLSRWRDVLARMREQGVH